MRFPAILVIAPGLAVVQAGRVGFLGPAQGPDALAGRDATNEHRKDDITPNVAEELKERQVSEDGRCGANFGTVCADDECCFVGGYCGQGYIYCSAPACQIDYGPACDANLRPEGPDTEGVDRSMNGPVPYGESIYHCEEYGDIALTYDDGPWLYTGHLLDLLASYDAKATFFITGRNLGKGPINDPDTPWPALLQRMVEEGHQVASHTWSHQRLTELSETKFRHQMTYNEIAIADVLGFFPSYMRPPYSASNPTTDGWLADLGYHITYFNLDTEGYLHGSANEIQVSKDIWDAAVEGKDPDTTKWLQIEHDPEYQSVYNLTGHMLESLFRNGCRSVTVGECLGDSPDNWYRSVPGAKPRSPASWEGFPATEDGRCGFEHGSATCHQEPVARCCSKLGWCGSTDDECGTNCQPLFGLCDGVPEPRWGSGPGGDGDDGDDDDGPPPSSTSSAAGPGSTLPISRDGHCGEVYDDTTCIEEPGATCCSQYGWCGSTSAHCGDGCQSKYGTCGSSL